MLHLEPRIHLQKIEARLVAGAVEQKLHRAGVAVAGRARNRDGGLAHARAQRGRQRNGRRFLDHFLMPALQRALALEQVDHVAVMVGQDLDLDVARTIDQALDVERAVAKRRQRLAPRLRDRRQAARRPPAHAFIPIPPPPSDGLISTGNPSRRAAAAIASSVCSAGVSPGTTGTPACDASCRAAIFDPMRAMTSAGGPMNATPAAAHAAANAWFSERKP